MGPASSPCQQRSNLGRDGSSDAVDIGRLAFASAASAAVAGSRAFTALISGFGDDQRVASVLSVVHSQDFGYDRHVVSVLGMLCTLACACC